MFIVAGQPPPLTRLLAIVTASASSADDEEPESILRKIHILHTPTLPNILSTFLHPQTHFSTSFPPPNTSLIIIDDLSTPVSTSFPTGIDDPPHAPPPDAPHPKPRGEKPETMPMKRARILASLGAGMARIAATQNTAILIISHMTSRIIRAPLSTTRGAVLVPYLGESWTGSLGVRITLFRNDIPTKLLTPAPTAAGMGDEDVGIGVRHAFISRSPSNGNSTQNKTIVFRITDSGLADLPLIASSEDLDQAAAASTLKRKRQMTEEGDYGWVEEEEEGCSQVLEGVEEEIMATQRKEEEGYD
ncbi:hypothetical protein SAICODRAFT_26628 [Saitoella complicata NRRL Y-17804]|uniref:uncharacterized protein n=1 Tax=Saitoella complicata (strain BCRC 22490 / CBS 7301 / JCM 7358 / NBRC 10748 / NRRL Y-17804) TaxID=698492 RepID=UPI000867635F|nr:uncharacterized protein SAICODRAFT_26628 [Saitoella complicata NRRL Y-17804]ODQ51532.1 hypothetical protein SAICODRAFT_26628 [Saitoella complicata NRRL Y-17804]